MVSHRMAILAMDQYGLLLCGVVPEARACDSLKAVRDASGSGRLAVFLPSKFLSRSDPFEPSWDVTSDSIAAFIAHRLSAEKTVFVTDVDGIFIADPKSGETALLEEVSVETLLKLPSRTSVDRHLPRFLSVKPMDCYVVNGKYPDRVTAVLSGRTTVCTRIRPCAKN